MSDIERTYGALPGRLESPAVRRMAQVAELLRESLRKRVVFIGASLLPLMETEEHVISTPPEAFATMCVSGRTLTVGSPRAASSSSACPVAAIPEVPVARTISG